MKMLMGAALFVLLGISVTQAQPAGKTSTASGVFTAEQAKNGESAFQARCAACHGANLHSTAPRRRFHPKPLQVRLAAARRWRTATSGFAALMPYGNSRQPGRPDLHRHRGLDSRRSTASYPESQKLEPDVAGLGEDRRRRAGLGVIGTAIGDSLRRLDQPLGGGAGLGGDLGAGEHAGDLLAALSAATSATRVATRLPLSSALLLMR